MNIRDFQSWIWSWMLNTFGPVSEVSIDRPMRFFEEAVELAQATDLTKDQAHQLVDYVYGREKGDPFIEIGDVLLTLAGVASSRNVQMEDSARAVKLRATRNAEKIAAKRKMRPTDGSALPTK